MYNVPVYRIRAYIRGLRRPRPSRRASQPSAPLHLKKAPAEIRVTDGYAFPKETTSAMVILNELTPKGLSLYCDARFHPGQQVAITIEEPRRFYARARVLAVEHIGVRPSVISENPLPYRITVAFEYQDIDELMVVKSYCEELAREHLYPSPLRRARGIA